MKAFRLLLFFAIFSGGLFYSCSDDDPIKGQPSTNQSIALRTLLNEVKKSAGISGRNDSALCFNFVYPINLSFNTGTTVTINSFEGLLDILGDESPAVFLNAISYPFNITNGGAVSVQVTTEAQFLALLEECGYTSYNDNLDNSFCFDIVYPVSVTTPNGTFEIDSYEQFAAYLNGSATGGVEFVFPIQILTAGEVLTVHNIYDLYEVINSCDTCICTYEYAPVCVETPNGTLMFGNSCHAICSGFTQADFFACNPDGSCTIENLSVFIGDCSASGQEFQLTIDFNHTTTAAQSFEVYTSTGQNLGAYSTNDLPITVAYPSYGPMSENVTVVLNNGVDSCSATQQFAAPDCSPTTLNTFGEYLVSGCFDMQYPLQVQWQGALVTIDSDDLLLQYYNPTPTTYFPPFNYPVTVVYQGVPLTVTSDAEFMTAIGNMDCN